MKGLLAQPASREGPAKIEALQGDLDQLLIEFDSMATRLPLEAPEKGEKSSDWIKQLEELTMPLLQAIRDLTEKPRRIDNLKKKIARLEIQLEDFISASKEIEVFILAEKQSPSPASQEAEQYKKRIHFLKNKYDPELVRLNLEKARFNLERALQGSESMVDSASNALKDFFKNRGRNLLVTIGTFIGLWWLLTRLRKWIVIDKSIIRLSPSFAKLFTAAYNVFVLIFCMLASLACLYFFNDWLLISLIAMVSLLVIWTSRQWIPKFLQEIKLIINLGTVREKERLIWNGVPWRVKEIRLQAILVNDSLEGGEIRLPVHELIGKHSRPVVEHEAWFPTRPQEWVILADTSYGQVVSQTMEQVVLKLKGGALKYYATADFLSATPVNISNGFRYAIQFGLDYGVQSRICDEIPKLFEDGVKKLLHSHLEGDDPDIESIEITFDHAAASSLNMAVIVHVRGRCAENYEEIQREVQAALVKVCNENNLTIPFNQLTVSLAGDSSNITPPTAS
jgi:hypothetical protein